MPDDKQDNEQHDEHRGGKAPDGDKNAGAKEKGGGDAKPSDADKNGKRDGQGRPRRIWPFAVAAVVVLGFIAIVLVILFTPTPNVWTDDAYVMVHYASIAPRIAGQVSAVDVNDEQSVGASQELVQLDDRDQRAALANARAMLARDQAQFHDALANVDRQPSLIRQQDQSSKAFEAQIGLAEANQRRYRNLAATGAGTEQSRQTADATLAQLRAQLGGSQAAADAARHQLDVLHAMADADRATIASDEANVRQAELNLSYTRVLAPLDGMVSERSVQVGDYVGPGKVMMTIVPIDRMYVIANYRELALRHVLPGQHVRVHVDAYDIVLDGVVVGVPGASGEVYSPIPSNNATGNFTKIVQRLPVKILISPGQPAAGLLRAGFSVETTIGTGLADVVAQQNASNRPITAPATVARPTP